MRAVWMAEFGPPAVLVAGSAPDPEPGAGQVVVGVSVIGIAFVETQRRAGRSFPPGDQPRLPMIPGNAVGGVVIAAGPGAAPELVGRRVVSSTGGSGAYAEQVAVAAAEVIEVPADLDLPAATALLADGRTAIGLARLAGVSAGDRVLVEAAAGGVGSLLVQLAAGAGATVIAAASSQRKLELASGLGADAVVDYTEPGWPERVRQAAGGGVDVVFDGVGGSIGQDALALLGAGGRFVLHGLASGSFTDTSAAAERGVQVTGLRQWASLGLDNRELTRLALVEAAAGRLRPVIGQTFPLAAAADAHAAIEARSTLGKTLLLC
ncbi:MAG TPA: zinc-binding dehydrogenase [Mycobacteriales bacterium]|nr:zinc-binding dehydrogenase [Mycobacteriales bacterium]